MARKRIKEEPRKTILIVTATEAEALYFSQMRKDCRFSNMTVQWVDRFKDLQDLVMISSRLRNAGNYANAWVVFGLANLGVTPAQVKELLPLAKKKKVRLAWTNPSFPLWYLLHLQTPRAFVEDANAINKALATPIAGFSDDANYLLTDGLNLHLKLYPYKSRAAVNASNYNGLVEARLGLPATNLVTLFNDITDVCGLADLTHNQKQLGMKKS
jgi:hypothetical protein